jgi:hypothetical protein
VITALWQPAAKARQIRTRRKAAPNPPHNGILNLNGRPNGGCCKASGANAEERQERPPNSPAKAQEDGQARTSVSALFHTANMYQRQRLPCRVHSQRVPRRGMSFRSKVEMGLIAKGGFARCYMVNNRQNRQFAAKVIAKASLKTPKAKGKVLYNRAYKKFMYS